MFKRISTTVVSFFLLSLFAMNAQAQATRTWVSGVGDDANPCSRTAPCKTFAGAISKTATGGIINALDPAGYGSVTITKAISIIGTGTFAGITAPSSHGITINAGANDRIYLEGLDLEGTGNGLSGIRVLASGRVVLKNSNIRGFSTGVDIQGLAGTKIYIENTTFTGNGTGVNAAGTAGALNRAIIHKSTFNSNTGGAINANTGSIITLSSSIIEGAASAISNGGGSIESYGDNIIRGSGTPTTILTKN